MNRSPRLALALTTSIGLLLAGCGDAPPDDPAATDQPGDLDDTGLDDLAGDLDLPDPNDAVEDGIYRGLGVALPVPDGWTLDPAALQQGLVAAVSEDGTQQLTARAFDLGDVAPGGEEPPDFEMLLDGARQQIPVDPDIDEEVGLAGADRAHRLTFLDLPPQQEGAPSSSVTLVVALDERGLIGEFVFAAATDVYEDAMADLLLAEAGFDPDSVPPTPPQPPSG